MNLQELENRLWSAADQLWANTGLKPSEFSNPGIIGDNRGQTTKIFWVAGVAGRSLALLGMTSAEKRGQEKRNPLNLAFNTLIYRHVYDG